MQTPIRGATRRALLSIAVVAIALLTVACAAGMSGAAPSMPAGGGQGQAGQEDLNAARPAASMAPQAPDDIPDGHGVGQGDNAAVRGGAKITRTGPLRTRDADVPA